MIAKGFDDGLSGWFGLTARHEGYGRLSTWFPVRPGLCDSTGALRLTALVFSVDSAVGIAAGLAALPDWVVTTDIHLQIFGPVTVGPVRAEAVALRRGRSQVLAEARLWDEGSGDAPVGLATANHAALTPDGGPPMDLLPVGEIQRAGRPPADSPGLDDRFGVAVTGPGRAELAMGPHSRNPWGILHGALHALLVERAAASLAPGPVADLMVRFLAPVRVGPAVATAAPVGERDGRTVLRVEVRDDGADRLASVSVVSVPSSAGRGPQRSTVSRP